MYSVFIRIPDPSILQNIIDVMNPYIAQEGGKIVSDTDNLADPNKFTL
jgi:hypothetical protein